MSNNNTDPEPDNSINGVVSLEEVRLYNPFCFKDFPPYLMTESLANFTEVNNHILDEEEVPNHRVSVLYQPTSNSFEGLTSPNKLEQSGGGCFCSLLSQDDRLSVGPFRPKIICPNFQQGWIVPEEKEIANLRLELNLIKTQQNQTLKVVEYIREEVGSNSREQKVSESNFDQIQLLRDMNDKLVRMHQNMDRLVQSHQQGFDELSRRLSHLEETMSVRRRPSRASKSKPEIIEEPWEKPLFTCIGTFSGHESSVTCLVGHQSHLMSGSSTGEIRVWDTTDLKCVLHANFTSDPVSCMAVSEQLLIVANEVCSIYLVDLSTMKLASLQTQVHKGGIFAMSVVDDYLFTSSLECIKVWKIEKFQIRFEHTIDGLSHNVRALHYDINQNLLYSGAHNSVHGWNTKSPFHLAGKLESQKLGTIFSLTSIEDCLFVGTYNQNIHVVNKHTFQTVKILQSHISCITALITGPGESCVISGSQDASVVVWHTPIMLAFQKLQRHKGVVNALAIVNEYMFSAGGDGEIKVFDWTNMKVFKVAHAQTQNQLV